MKNINRGEKIYCINMTIKKEKKVRILIGKVDIPFLNREKMR